MPPSLLVVVPPLLVTLLPTTVWLLVRFLIHSLSEFSNEYKNGDKEAYYIRKQIEAVTKKKWY